MAHQRAMQVPVMSCHLHPATRHACQLSKRSAACSWSGKPRKHSASLPHVLLRGRSSSYTPIDGDGNTLGAVAPVAGTPLDFTSPAPIGARLSAAPRPPTWPAGYDSNLALFGLTNMTARSNVHDCNAHATCAPSLYSRFRSAVGRVNWCRGSPPAWSAALATWHCQI